MPRRQRATFVLAESMGIVARSKEKHPTIGRYKMAQLARIYSQAS